ncbi:hypothetical protein P3551_23665 [Vibrio parahaemolyticus]|uniref:hypothetical protein n=1 Tax=Vibrio harveyi group TaxID=717610 RepID=UPI00111F4C00|nr:MULTISPECIES: hypothetical protein [Vibrio harveyi group]HDY8044302.1 hypothetical protein [Vibrio vulnificus]EGR2186103.1 hypothetical protein [Vibrio parahaemolyticus]MDF4902263.1 hypothetical protein [Vibrio parahaemolyticus]MEA5184949.1 hypothetical protein [Vibrio parahaemolyticus]TOM28200.1 hypothetical protein CGH81_06495 [Vibrio parahaemolyticus]
MSTILNWSVTLGTLVVSIWGAYTAYDASKAKQHLDDHSSIVKSFQNEIESASKRKDNKKVEQLRYDYEKYESDWREGRIVKAQLKIARIDGFSSISIEERESILNAYMGISKPYRDVAFSSQELGDISFINGQVEFAVKAYSQALIEDPNNTMAAIYGASAIVSALESNPKNDIPKPEIESFLQALQKVDKESSDAVFATIKLDGLERKLEQELKGQQQ